MKTMKYTLIAGALAAAAILSGCTAGEEIGMPNPASVYCEEQGGTLEMREGEGGTVGFCIFEDGSECEEWAFFNGECAIGDSIEIIGMPNPASVFCEEQGGTIEMREGGAGALGFCIFEDGSECEEWAFFNGECAIGDSIEIIGMPNPASVFCEEQGGTLEMREGEAGTVGFCIFDDGSQCEEWSFFNGACQKGDNPADVEGEGDEILAIFGRVVSLEAGLQFDDYLQALPEESAGIGLEGITPEIEAQIVALRDKQPPGAYAHFWGTLLCPAIDFGECQLRVSRLRVDGPGEFYDPDPIEGWTGVIVTGRTEPGSGGDDYFLLDAPITLQYGIVAAIGESGERELEPQIVALRDTGTRVRIWGSLMAGIPDWNGTQIEVTRLEIVGQ
jgi:putative hemolysin